MKLLAEHPFLGLEYDWLAVDCNQHLGFFSTAGFGPIPQSLSELKVWVLDYTPELPPSVAAKLVQTDGHDYSAWTGVATRGIFAFDWCSQRESYELIAIPEHPLFLSDATPIIQELAEITRFDQPFSTLNKLSVD